MRLQDQLTGKVLEQDFTKKQIDNFKSNGLIPRRYQEYKGGRPPTTDLPDQITTPTELGDFDKPDGTVEDMKKTAKKSNIIIHLWKNSFRSFGESSK